MNNIESQIARFLQKMFFPVMNESFSRHITVLIESVDDSVLGTHVFSLDRSLQSTSLAQFHKKFLLHFHSVIVSVVSEILILCMLHFYIHGS